MGGIAAPCPLCGDTFADDESYAAHLADAHGLVDDDGADATTVEHALVVSGIALDRELAEEAEAAKAASIAGLEGEDLDTVHPSRIYDPNQDDHRFRPYVLGLAGLLLIAAVGVGLVATGGDDAREVAATETTIAGAPVDALATTSTTVAVTEVTAAPPDPSATADAVVAVADPAGSAPPPTAPPTTRAPTTAPPTTRPPVTAPPTTAAPPPPPTTAAPPPQFAVPALAGARIDDCTRSGPDGTWTFSYVLSGGANWAPAPGARALSGGRYQEARVGKRSNGFPASAIVVVDTTTGQNRSITLSPQLQGASCA